MRHAILGLMTAFVALLATGCNSTAADTFRSASSSDLQAGVQSILDGVVAGGFAIYTPK